MIKENDAHNGMSIKKYQTVKPKNIWIVGEYMYTHEKFIRKLTVNFVKVSDRSFLVEIIAHEDELEYRKKQSQQKLIAAFFHLTSVYPFVTIISIIN
ncbi:hypothetical protein [Enterococcus devriesei]|uniref:hypothetical protein n=1 Tax=Enterococcus devriesei TaxID=319970 RepID=UPI0028EFF8B8|nr:hypothetical protein [Enterococcus devriesei]